MDIIINKVATSVHSVQKFTDSLLDVSKLHHQCKIHEDLRSLICAKINKMIQMA